MKERMDMDFENNPNFGVIPTNDLSHSDWLNLRRKGIGGSDLAGIMGMSQYATPIDVYLDKTWQTENDEEENPLFWWGHKLEPLVIEKYREDHLGEAIHPTPYMLVSKAWPWMLANLDGEIIIENKPGVFEIKTIGFAGDEWGRDGGNEEDIPEKYYCQVAHYLAVTGFKYAVVVAFFMASREIRRYFIKRDEEVIKHIVTIEERFWKDNVIPQEPPVPTNSADCNKLWQWDKGTTLTAGDGTIMASEELRCIKQNIKSLEKEKDNKEAIIKSSMGENQILLGLGGEKICSWKNQTARRFNVKKFAIEHPGLNAEYRNESTSRVFRFK